MATHPASQTHTMTTHETIVALVCLLLALAFAVGFMAGRYTNLLR